MPIVFHSSVPKLPANDLEATRLFYEKNLNFKKVPETYPDYLILFRDTIELHFFLHRQLDVTRNFAMCYIRVTGVDELYSGLKTLNPACVGKLETKPWRQKEFSLTDNQNNQITFGETV